MFTLRYGRLAKPNWGALQKAPTMWAPLQGTHVWGAPCKTPTHNEHTNNGINNDNNNGARKHPFEGALANASSGARPKRRRLMGRRLATCPSSMARANSGGPSQTGIHALATPVPQTALIQSPSCYRRASTKIWRMPIHCTALSMCGYAFS